MQERAAYLTLFVQQAGGRMARAGRCAGGRRARIAALRKGESEFCTAMAGEG